MTKGADTCPIDSHQAPSQRRRFPGWRWVAVALAFPIAGLIGWKVGGRVDAVGAALLGGALTGAGLGAVQWWAAKGALGRAAAWIGSSAVGYAVGLAVGAALVGYDTDLGDLATMGAVSGLVLGAAQGLALAAQGRKRLAVAWATAMPVLFALGGARRRQAASVSRTSSPFSAYRYWSSRCSAAWSWHASPACPRRWRDGRCLEPLGSATPTCRTRPAARAS